VDDPRRFPVEEAVDSLPWDSFIERFQTLDQRRTSTAISKALLGLTWYHRWLDGRRQPQLDQSFQYFQKARNLDAKSEYTAIYLGRVHFHRGELEAAAAAFRGAIRANAAGAAAHFWLGTTLLRQGKFETAETELAESLGDKAWEFQALDQLGNISKARGNLNEAEDLWRKALSKSPMFVPPWRSLLEETP
jgi:tetratricopeptide (TPR) repeat protein